MTSPKKAVAGVGLMAEHTTVTHDMTLMWLSVAACGWDLVTCTQSLNHTSELN
jgi:hypothetical protein